MFTLYHDPSFLHLKLLCLEDHICSAQLCFHWHHCLTMVILAKKQLYTSFSVCIKIIYFIAANPSKRIVSCIYTFDYVIQQM